MSNYAVHEIRRDASGIHEAAVFLAGFVRDGELPEPGPGDDEPAVWAARLRHWWLENPFVREDSILGLRLVDGEGQMVGFHAFIPRDYVLNGNTVPGLLASTFFVREAHRSAVLGIFLRIQRLARRHHMVDGTPTAPVQELLEKFGFERVTPGTRYLIPVRQQGWSPAALVMRGARLADRNVRGPAPPPLPGRLVTDPAEIRAVPPLNGSRLHPAVTAESIRWQLQAGSGEPKQLVAWLDEAGKLRAYFLAGEERRKGLTCWRIGHHGSFDAEGRAVADLIDHFANAATCKTRPANLRLLDWPLLEAADLGGKAFRPWKSIAPPIYYSRPKALAGAVKHCQAFDGDSIYL